MRSRILILMLAAVLVLGANTRLYLKDGTYQMVREYQVLEDRVRYLSAERGEWEEIPLALLDLDRTKKEVAAREDAIKVEAKELEEEDAAIKAEREEISHIPHEPGVYYIHESKLEPLQAAEVKIVTDKSRVVLRALSPVPLIPGKSTVELDGSVAQFRITESRPAFYFRLSAPEGLALVKLPAKRNLRIVETVTKLPVSEEIQEQRQTVDTFKQAIGDQLYKIWPEKPLEPGEYGLMQFAEGAIDPQVWDFGVGPVK